MIPGRRWALVVGALVALTGCATKEMKGTPFYTGDYGIRQGPVEDRVNLWPLVYYRKPALSVVWPFVEKTDEHFAIRPLYSVYGLDRSNHIYNVLWPLAQFDRQSDDNRIFPVYWGKDYGAVFPLLFWGDGYFVGFPLYWHFGHPLGSAGGYDGLFPFWSYYSDRGAYSLYCPWPFIHRQKSDTRSGWHAWPLLGSYTEKNGGYYRFQLWPFIHQYAAPEAQEKWNTAIPLYFARDNKEGSLFLSLPWSSCDKRDGSSWQLLPPLYYSRQTPSDRLFATLLGGWKSGDDGRSWMIVPLLSWGRADPEGRDAWFLGPLVHAGRNGDARSSHVIPFYYYSKNEVGRKFISLPWSSSLKNDGSAWQLVPPIYFHSRDGVGSKLITPIWAGGRSRDGKSAWHALIPLYYSRKSDDGNLFATLAGGYRTDVDGKHWLVYPLLSWGNRTRDGGEFWTLAPLVHAQWDKKGTTSHVIPFYYRNSHSGTFVSPVVAKWKRGDSRTTLIPPALSWKTTSKDRKDLWVVGPLAHFSWGTNRGASHLFPFYYRNAKTGSQFSPFVCTWKNEDRQNWLIPLLLSEYSKSKTDKEIWGPAGLFHKQWGETGQNGHLLPLYAYEKGDYFYTPLFGLKSGDKGFGYALTPLVGFYRGNSRGGWLFPLISRNRNEKANRTTGNLLWATYRREKDQVNTSMFPFYTYHNYGPLNAPLAKTAKASMSGKDFFCIPFCWYRNQSFISSSSTGAARTVKRENRKEDGVFPIWSYARSNVVGSPKKSVRTTVLIRLFDYDHAIEEEPGKSGVNDYARARVLWRVWHYERLNGDVSVDMLPAITYDRKADGFKKISFLWRFFRYERSAGGAKKLDLCFIPVMRTKGKA